MINIKGVFAVKIFDKAKMKKEGRSQNNLDMLTNEINAMRCVHSQFITKIVELIKLKNCYNIIMELANGGSLIDLLNVRQFSEEEVNLIIRQLVKGCYVLFEKNIVHRDLNIKNVLIHFPELEVNAESLQ